MSTGEHPSKHPAEAALHAALELRKNLNAPGAWRSKSAWVAMLVTVVVSIVIDLASKEWAFATVADQPVKVSRVEVLRVKEEKDPRLITPELIPEHKPMVIVSRLLDFQLVLNPGAVFGVGPGKRLFFIGFTALALAFSLMMFARWTTPVDRIAHIGIGLVIGGGIGNLYDRLVYACVRDFIHPLPGLLWPGQTTIMGNREVWPYVSNLADLFLLVGIVMLLVHLWRRDAHNDRLAKALKAASDAKA
jgi:signal peptidase II